MSDDRPCTCHPDDNPPVPCERQYALTACRVSRLARIAGLREAAEIAQKVDPDKPSGDYEDGFLEGVSKTTRAILARIAELETSK